MSVTTFEGLIHRTSPKAICFQGHYWEGSLWLPASQVTVEPDNEDTGSVVIKVRDWLARKNNLLEFTYYSEAEIEAMNER